MVRALLAGTKTQTRRICKQAAFGGVGFGHTPAAAVHPDGSGTGWIAWYPNPVSAELTKALYQHDEGFKCPYGLVGDRLWVRETWGVQEIPGAKREHRFSAGLQWAADLATSTLDVHLDQWRVSYEKRGKWRPSIHMPRWASRIDLEITEVRVQRLQDISEEDALAEGVDRAASQCPCEVCARTSQMCPATASGVLEDFRSLWDSINGEGAWARNDWVWAISFKRVWAISFKRVRP